MSYVSPGRHQTQSKGGTVPRWGGLPHSHFARPASLTTALIQASGAARNTMKEAQSDQSRAASLQEAHMAQLHLSVEHWYDPKDLTSLQNLGSVHFYKDHGLLSSPGTLRR